MDNLATRVVNFPVGIDLNEIQFAGDQIPANSESCIAKMLEDARVNLQQPMTPPVPCLEVIGAGGERATFGTFGNISLVIGKAKSKKTFFIGVLLAASITNRNTRFRIIGHLPEEQKQVLYIDTEQGRFHVQRAGKRVLELSGISSNSNLQVLALRKHSPAVRLEMVEHAIRNTPNLGLVVIDGIRDLVTSINDEEEATEIASKLLKWTEELNIHIVCVLHQNKGDNNARGHLGTELQNKAESVISVTRDTKNKDISIVTPEYCRDKDFEPFAFEINKEGLPRLVENWTQKGESKSKRISSPEDVPAVVHEKALDEIYAEQATYNYTPLAKAIKSALRNQGITIGDNKAKDFITYYQEKGMVVKKGVSGSRATLYSRSKPLV